MWEVRCTQVRRVIFSVVQPYGRKIFKMEPIITRYLPTPYGELLLGSFNGELCLCDWRYRRMRSAIDTRIQRALITAYEEGTSPLIEQAISQLEQYAKGDRSEFDLPLKLIGTEFQQKVWQGLRTVPYGRTLSYAELTAKVAEPNAIRAVATANGANAISIIIPCHRIIGSSGELVGYAGGVRMKRRLLELEGSLPKELDLFSTLAEN